MIISSVIVGRKILTLCFAYFFNLTTPVINRVMECGG